MTLVVMTLVVGPLTFGRLDPIQAPRSVEGVMFLAAQPVLHRPIHRGPTHRRTGGGIGPPREEQR
jgi:hypothetical protein